MEIAPLSAANAGTASPADLHAHRNCIASEITPLTAYRPACRGNRPDRGRFTITQSPRSLPDYTRRRRCARRNTAAMYSRPVPDPQGADWGGLSWSDWYAFDQAISEDRIPSSAGIYRFRGRGEPGLLYIGEGADRRRRLRTLARYRSVHPASYYLH